ncbi:hypothetical protein COT94_03195 [Candidatus Falkowbacteria bacterium CG10_big_fil_rev_8_21_14_0_10_37_14]|uniref:Phosphoribosyltransferase domain-containing protein n=1 Tax=Candidatus Falkowbacteria bacterium CG10_big_fil_rev_8_21_14_0_10_37_14 TaxID=1974561 RepID=A0A2M6WT67_9BACT|nr:MAG: hypothetical protein COT94_03195 [Candidatus Falkowbacteria bacterium CG10_big_fil_rev_8_21_14_0_10_37_14]
MEFIGNNFNILIEALFPKRCFVCNRLGAWFCLSCRTKLPRRNIRQCLVCGRFNYWQQLCSDCGGQQLNNLIASYNYKVVAIANGLKACKYHFASSVGEELGELLAEYWLAWREEASQAIVKPRWFNSNLLIIPIPLASRRARFRGFNQSEILAEILARKTNYDLDRHSLIRLHFKKPQAELSASDRQSNVLDAFKWTGTPLKGRNILLIDDVATTGSTLISAAKALKIGGAGQVIGLVLAHG